MSALLTPYAFADRMLITGAIAQTIGYALEAPAPPFPVFVLGFAINGFGLALQVRLAKLHRLVSLSFHRMRVRMASWRV